MRRQPVFDCSDCPTKPELAKVIYTDPESKKQFCNRDCRNRFNDLREDKRIDQT